MTGANGFIGRRVVDKLLARGISVRALVLPGETVLESWNGRVDIIRGDITDRKAVEQAMDGARTVIL